MNNFNYYYFIFNIFHNIELVLINNTPYACQITRAVKFLFFFCYSCLKIGRKKRNHFQESLHDFGT